MRMKVRHFLWIKMMNLLQMLIDSSEERVQTSEDDDNNTNAVHK